MAKSNKWVRGFVLATGLRGSSEFQILHTKWKASAIFEAEILILRTMAMALKKTIYAVNVNSKQLGIPRPSAQKKQQKLLPNLSAFKSLFKPLL